MSTMSPEVEARWQRTHERWEKETPGLPPPLRFEVPHEKVDITARVWFGDAFIDQRRLYAENRGGGRFKLIFLYWAVLIGAISMVLITLVTPGGTTLWLPNWVFTLVLFVLSYLISRLQKRVTRKSTIVFERETGKVYIPVDDKTPHQVLDFYDQHFFLTHGHVDANRYGMVNLYLPPEKLPDGRIGGDKVLRLAMVANLEDAQEAWHLLVRYMDKDWPFDDEALEYFDYVAQRKAKEGFKVEDIRRVPGERVFF